MTTQSKMQTKNTNVQQTTTMTNERNPDHILKNDETQDPNESSVYVPISSFLPNGKLTQDSNANIIDKLPPGTNSDVSCHQPPPLPPRATGTTHVTSLAAAYGPYKPVPPPKPVSEDIGSTKTNDTAEFIRFGSQKQEGVSMITNRTPGLPTMPHVLVTDQGHFHTHSSKFPVEIKEEKKSFNPDQETRQMTADNRSFTLDRGFSDAYKNNRNNISERTNSLPRSRPSILTNSHINSQTNNKPLFNDDDRLISTGRNSVRFAEGLEKTVMNYEPYMGPQNSSNHNLSHNGSYNAGNSYVHRSNDHSHFRDQIQTHGKAPAYYTSANGYPNGHDQFLRQQTQPTHSANHEQYHHSQVKGNEKSAIPYKQPHSVHFQTDQQNPHTMSELRPNGMRSHISHTNGIMEHRFPPNTSTSNNRPPNDHSDNTVNTQNEEKDKKDMKKSNRKYSNFKSIISKFSKTEDKDTKDKPKEIIHTSQPKKYQKQDGRTDIPLTFQADDRHHTGPLNASFRKAISFNTLNQNETSVQHPHHQTGVSSPKVQRLSQQASRHSMVKMHDSNGYIPRKSGSCGHLAMQSQEQWNKSQGSHWNLAQNHDDSFGRALPSDHAYPDIHISDSTRGGRASGGSDSGRGTGGSGADGKTHDTSLESGASSRQQLHGQSSGNESEWIDITEQEIPNLSIENSRKGISVNGQNGATTPPLPPLSPENSPKSRQKVSHRSRAQSQSFNTKLQKSEEVDKQSHKQTKEQSSKFSYNGKSKENFQRSASLLPSSMNGWMEKKHTSSTTFSKMEHKLEKNLPEKNSKEPTKPPSFRPSLDDDLTSNDGALDLDSVIDGVTEMTTDDDGSSAEGDDVYLIRKQLEGLEGMYSEVLKLLGTRKHQLRRRMHGSMSSLPSSVTTSRPIRDRRGRGIDDRLKKTSKDTSKTTHKRFQRLESHVVTLARSVAHLSSEMRTQQLMFQEMEGIRNELSSLRAATVGNLNSKNLNSNMPSNNLWENVRNMNGVGFSNPGKVKKLTQFFGDEPPLVRIFLRNLGYEKYAPIFEKERIGMLELPYLNEDRLQKIGIPLGPRLRIIQEAKGPIKRDGNLSVYVV